MTERYLLAKARNLNTGTTIKSQELDGVRYTEKQRVFVEAMAERLAQGLAQRTGEPWQGFVETYTATKRLR